MTQYLIFIVIICSAYLWAYDPNAMVISENVVQEINTRLKMSVDTKELVAPDEQLVEERNEKVGLFRTEKKQDITNVVHVRSKKTYNKNHVSTNQEIMVSDNFDLQYMISNNANYAPFSVALSPEEEARQKRIEEKLKRRQQLRLLEQQKENNEKL